MKIFHGRSVILCLLLLLLPHVPGDITFDKYRRALHVEQKTVSGVFSLFTEAGWLRCSSMCSKNGCVSWSLDKTTRECRVYSMLHPSLSTPSPSLNTYFPVGSNSARLAFRSQSSAGWTWNDALAACESVGVTLAYISDRIEGQTLITKYGVKALYIGLHQEGDEEVDWHDMYGNLVQNPDWRSDQPNDPDDTQDCGILFDDGVQDKRCTEVFDAVGICTSATP
ncbi:uncharacterized protein LOC121871679 [Homarus americanus]|uniref:Putative Lectin C-type domain-containing protein 4 n=1 Tax=Homarus americanus TaxID=6706 RepID=A0A8J5JU55_HOMAM|nr:uncharacterized protein LOC121871679 [Homarus americanus]KAG7164296.1 putative Lectin C-type domain-containing protein 4 [Homarus americanus]